MFCVNPLGPSEREGGRQDCSHGAGFLPSTVGCDVASDTHVGMLSDSFFDIYSDPFPGVFSGMLSDIPRANVLPVRLTCLLP